jgi:hypothetical protein
MDAKQEQAKELGRSLIAELAPSELPEFESTSREFFADPSVLRPARGEDILGLGLAEAATFITPIILMIATNVIDALAVEIGKSVAKPAAGLIAEYLKQLLRREPQAIKLTDRQIRHIRSEAVRVARRFKVPEAKAALIADALVARLATKPA